mgnify:CR=1 FL=1
MREPRRRAVARGVAVLGAVLSCCVAAPAVAAAADTPTGCTEQRLPVQVAGRQYTVAGTLCVPEGEVRGIQVLAHGGTYTRQYWDWPINSDQLSYVEHALADGYATFAYDRLGVGETDRPFGLTTTVSHGADALHQVISWASSLYDDVTVVSHSLGSAIAVNEAGRYNDADRLVVTGLLHVPFSARTPVSFATDITYPACLDPVTKGYGCDYLTSRPGARGDLVYSDTADPAVIEYDEAHKSAMAAGQLASGITELAPGTAPASRIRIPVLLAMGGKDFFCGALLQPCTEASIRESESRYYANAASFDVYVEPTSGHNLALHPTAPQTEDAIDAWIRSQQK